MDAIHEVVRHATPLAWGIGSFKRTPSAAHKQIQGKHAVFLRLGFEMRVGYTQEIRCLERVEWSQRVFSYLTLDISINIDTVFRIKSNSLSHLLPLNNSRSQLCTFLSICFVCSFFQLKMVIIWYESPGYADMVAIQSSGSIVADMITALTHTIVKDRKMEWNL